MSGHLVIYRVGYLLGPSEHQKRLILDDICSLFVVPATAQMTFKVYNPHTKKQVWRSVSSSGFKPNGRSCKSDQFVSLTIISPHIMPWMPNGCCCLQEIKHTGSPNTAEIYSITASLDKTVQLSITFTRPADAPGFKLGAGENGGISTFGRDKTDAKRDGYVVQ